MKALWEGGGGRVVALPFLQLLH